MAAMDPGTDLWLLGDMVSAKDVKESGQDTMEDDGYCSAKPALVRVVFHRVSHPSQILSLDSKIVQAETDLALSF